MWQLHCWWWHFCWIKINNNNNNIHIHYHYHHYHRIIHCHWELSCHHLSSILFCPSISSSSPFLIVNVIVNQQCVKITMMPSSNADQYVAIVYYALWVVGPYPHHNQCQRVGWQVSTKQWTQWWQLLFPSWQIPLPTLPTVATVTVTATSTSSSYAMAMPTMPLYAD